MLGAIISNSESKVKKKTRFLVHSTPLQYVSKLRTVAKSEKLLVRVGINLGWVGELGGWVSWHQSIEPDR